MSRETEGIVLQQKNIEVLVAKIALEWCAVQTI